MKLIDADALEPSEVYMNYGFTRIVYMDDIDEMPTIEAEPVRHGKWIVDAEDFRHQIEWYECSQCRFESSTAYNYCPHCGARMDENEIDL